MGHLWTAAIEKVQDNGSDIKVPSLHTFGNDMYGMSFETFSLLKTDFGFFTKCKRKSFKKIKVPSTLLRFQKSLLSIALSENEAKHFRPPTSVSYRYCQH